MKRLYRVLSLSLIILTVTSCTNLDQHVYSVVSQENFWKTPEEIAAGVAPVYQSLTGICKIGSKVFQLNEWTSDELVVPTRGADWYNGGVPQQLYLHTWTPVTITMNDAWGGIFNGIGRANYILLSLSQLKEKPDNIANIVAGVKIMRAYYYYIAMDLFGNVPLVTSYNIDPNKVTNSSRKKVYDFIEKEVKENIDLLPTKNDATNYGRATKWMAYCLLAKLYLNAEVYTGQAQWQDCINACDSIIQSGQYSLSSDYFDNFSPDNEGSPENIFVVPFDKVNITGNSWENFTLPYQSEVTFQMSGGPYNGACAPQAFYNLFDTSSIYTTKNGNVYRTYLSQRAGQWLIGQQFSTPYPYPPYEDVLYKAADPTLKLKDVGTGLYLNVNPVVNSISNSSATFRLAGVRSLKYFPQAGTSTNQSNDMVLYRYADVLLMKAECEVRLTQDLSNALHLINKIRERTYSGNKSHDWTMADLTLSNILAERGREMAWEGWRRQDLIRFQVASGNPYYTGARVPEKKADPADNHTLIFPIPAQQITANPNLTQNKGY